MPQELTSPERPLTWAFDVSTCWANRGQPPVGITRTELEFARRAYDRPNVTLTVYDRKRRKHIILPDDHARALLGLSSHSKTDVAKSALKAAVLASGFAILESLGHSVWCLFRLALILPSLALLPPKSSRYRKRKHRALKVLAKNQAFLPRIFRNRLERMLGAHASRPKYLQDYENLKRGYGNPTLQKSLHRSMRTLDFSKITAYATVGCGWDRNNLEEIYRLKKLFGFKVITSVYDLVPIVMPDVVPLSVTNSFLPYLCNLLWASDVVTCISNHTAEDLSTFIAQHSAPLPQIEICRLGSECSSMSSVRPAIADELRGRPFALYVATFEPRKNHSFIYFIWRELIRRNRVAPIPLVLAGRRGWRTVDFLERVRLSKDLYPDYLILAEGLTDPELAWLYSKCRFTVFPTLYEGWGLPVSESLSYGKYCISSDNSSLPEAGQGLAKHISLLDGRKWLEDIERCIGNDEYLQSKEVNIVKQFQRRNWSEAAAEFLSIVDSATHTATIEGNSIGDRHAIGEIV